MIYKNKVSDVATSETLYDTESFDFQWFHILNSNIFLFMMQRCFLICAAILIFATFQTNFKK